MAKRRKQELSGDKLSMFLVVISVGALVLLFGSIGYTSITGLEYAVIDSESSPPSTLYDAELCIRKGYLESGNTYDFTGVIGCPLFLTGGRPVDFTMTVVPDSGIAHDDETKRFQVIIEHVSGQGFVNVSLANEGDLPQNTGGPGSIDVTYDGGGYVVCPVGFGLVTGCVVSGEITMDGNIMGPADNVEKQFTIITRGSSLAELPDRVTREAPYTLTVIPDADVTGCLGGAPNGVCEWPETQLSCQEDCFTSTWAISPAEPKQKSLVNVNFSDSRYIAGRDVKIDLKIDFDTADPDSGLTDWLPPLCNYVGIRMGPDANPSAVPEIFDWNELNIDQSEIYSIISEDRNSFYDSKDDVVVAQPDPLKAGTIAGHFVMKSACTLPPSVIPGYYRLVAIPEIF